MPLAAVGSGIYLLAVLVCPVAMGLMMWFMGRGMMGGKRDPGAKHSKPALEDLKAEQARLAEKIALLDGDAAPARARDGQPEREAVQTGA